MNTVAATLPTVRLKPKADPRPIRRGAPWVFADELVLDRRTRALPAGTIARLEDAERRPLGVVAVNPLSKIAARLLDPDPAATIGPDWLATRLTRALALRARLYDAPFCRLVHAEGDGLPGLVIDRFGDVAAMQPNAAWADRMAGDIAEVLQTVAGVTAVVLNGTGRARSLEGLGEEMRVLAGRLDGPVPVVMNGATYMADLLGGQKTGLYYDQRENHAFAARLARGGRVLDLFTHVGGFALAALAGGATQALGVDSSAPALALAEEGARASDLAERLETRRGDVFAVLEALAGEGEKFETVVADPPAFAPNRQALERGLRAYERVALMAAARVAPGGFLVLCSCSHAAGLDAFRTVCLRGIGRSGRRAQLLHVGGAGPDHPQHPALAETGYLKALFFRLDG